MIGNAVPIRLGVEAGRVVQDLLRMAAGKRAKKPTVASREVHLRPHVRTRTYFKAGEVASGEACYYEGHKDAALPLFDSD